MRLTALRPKVRATNPSRYSVTSQLRSEPFTETINPPVSASILEHAPAHRSSQLHLEWVCGSISTSCLPAGDHCGNLCRQSGTKAKGAKIRQIYRREPDANMAWFYALSVEASLFGDAALIREWGRIGTSGKRKIELHETEDSAVEALEMWLRRKQRQGYVTRLDQSRTLPGEIHRIQSAPSPRCRFCLAPWYSPRTFRRMTALAPRS
jgi:predicted DNA-binding WGR domain protein